MSTPTVCILGCGSIARLHARIAGTLRSHLSIAFASRDRDRAEAYRAKYNGIAAYDSYESACAAPDVDAVFICTPHAHHVEHAALATTHGKPMLIEKPITRNLEELAEIETMTAQASVPCMVAENYYFKPLIRVVREHVAEGDIGRPVFLELNKTGISRNTGWRTDAEMMGGGALLEGGCHWVNLLLELGGSPTAVLAAKPDVDYPPAAPFEDNLQILVRFENGAVGKLLHSWRTHNRVAGLSASKLFGTEGNITFESNGLWALVLGKRKRFRVPGLLDIMGYREMLRGFADSVREGTPPPLSLATIRRDMELIFGAYRSLESGRWEELNGSREPTANS